MRSSIVLSVLLASSWAIAVAPAPQLDRRAMGPCSVTEIQPAPTQSLCAAQGRIPRSALALLTYTRVSRRERARGHGFYACEMFCLDAYSNCNSFSYDPVTFRCGLYFKSLADQRFVASNDTDGALYYDRGCFRLNQYCSAYPFSTRLHQPATTCTLTYHTSQIRHPRSQCFRTNIALKTSVPIAQPSHPTECAYACLMNSRCGSFVYQSYDNSETNCQLFGESLEEQGIVTNTATSSLLQTYFDRICYSTTCRDCYEVTPTTTYHPPSTATPTCKPNAVPQIIQNPSFEDNASGAPWRLGENVTLIRNKPSNASDGLNFIQFTLTKGTNEGIYLNQTLTGLTPGAMYTLRFSVQVTANNDAIFSFRIDDDLFYNTVQKVDYVKQSPYVRQYATFTAKNVTAELSFEFGPYSSLESTAQISLDNVEGIPALPTKACTFRLQLSSSITHINGSYVNLKDDRFPASFLTANYSAAETFGITGFNQLYSSGSIASLVAGNYFYQTALTCSVTAAGALSCIDKKLSQRAFRYCNTCSDFTNGFGNAVFYLVDAQDPQMPECPLITLYTVPI